MLVSSSGVSVALSGTSAGRDGDGPWFRSRNPLALVAHIHTHTHAHIHAHTTDTRKTRDHLALLAVPASTAPWRAKEAGQRGGEIFRILHGDHAFVWAY